MRSSAASTVLAIAFASSSAVPAADVVSYDDLLRPPVKAEELKKIVDAAPARASAKPAKPRKLLVFTLCKGFVHSSVPYGAAAMAVLGRKTGAWETVVTDDPAVFAPASLAAYDAVCFDNTTGTPFAEADRKQALMDFVRGGKGVVGIHAATDCFYDWAEFGEMMGGYFSGHPWNEEVVLKLDDPASPLNAAFGGKGFAVADEIYQFRDPYSRDALRVLTSLDTAKTNMKKGGLGREDNDYAVSWVRHWGKGRVFYCSLGHRHEVFWTPEVLRHYLDGVQYAFGDLKADDAPVPLPLKSSDPYTGIYEGTFTAGGVAKKAEARVIAEGGGSYRAVLTAEGVRAELRGGGAAAGRIDVRLENRPDAPKGVAYAYYEGDWDKLPDFQTLQPKKTGRADYFDIAARDRDDGFAFRFTGFVRIAEAGVHAFTTSSDDGSRLWIGDALVVDNDGCHGQNDVTGRIELAAGMHPVTVAFFEKGGGEVLEVRGGRVAETKEGETGLALEGGATSKGRLDGETLSAEASGGTFALRFVERSSPTAGKAPPPGAVVLLPFTPGESPSLDAWQNKGWRVLPDGSMEVRGGDNRTVESFGDIRLHLEFRIPFMPKDRGQGRGNSGVYFQDRYEVQVLDSFGLDSQDNDCCGIYGVAKPPVNACLPPLRWQTYDVTFRAPRFDASGTVTAKPHITVAQNGVTIHQDLELPRPTGGAAGDDVVPKGPLRLQDHGNPVRYRNIWIERLDAK